LARRVSASLLDEGAVAVACSDFEAHNVNLPVKAINKIAAQIRPPTVQEIFSGTNFPQKYGTKNITKQNDINQTVTNAVEALSRNLTPSKTKSPPKGGANIKYAEKNLRSAGVAFLNRSPEAHRAIQINNQGGITLADA
jgi:hypothetical protein